jgi:hypothetical protein
MLDLSNIPSQQLQTYTLYATGNWQTWNKPRNAKFIEIFCLGGGGGGGQSQVVGGGVNGGGGGAAGGIVRGLIPAFLLPDTLYILVGKGGAGSSTSNTAGGSGGISYIGIQPSTSEQTLICKSSTTVAGGGNINQSGGTAPTISVIALSAFGNLGLFTAIAGLGGSTAGSSAGTNGLNLTALATSLVTGGAGGGGKTTTVFGTGGNILSASAILTTQINGGVTAGQSGNDGYGSLTPFCGTGGSGGAGTTAGIGGRGGNGFYGCGGGGTGGGTVLSRAGDGGDGLVIITVIV